MCGLFHRISTGQPDQRGAAFIKGMAERLRQIGFVGEAYEVSFDGFKDRSALHCDDPERFQQRLASALNHATPVVREAGKAENSTSISEKALCFEGFFGGRLEA